MPGRRRSATLESIALAAICLGGVYYAMNARGFQVLGTIVRRVGTEEKLVALTFDDGPAPAPTREVLRILAAHHVRATFFLVGREMEVHPAAARAIAAAGHELGNHSYSHSRLIFTSLGTVRREIERTSRAIRAARYGGEIRFRPPFGKKLLVLPYYLWRHGVTTVTWDVEPESYEDVASSPERITQHVLTRTRAGSIILLHVMKAASPGRKALGDIIEGIRKRGFRFATVSELLTHAAPEP